MDLFRGTTSQIPRISVTILTVNQTGVAFPDPTQTSVSNWIDSCVITGHLVAVLCGKSEYWPGDHALFMG